MHRITKQVALLGLFGGALALGGCASAPPKGNPNETSMSAAYNSVYMDGGRDAITVLRQSLHSSGLYGSTDPYTPIRVPDQIIPVWVPAHTNNSTGQYIGGHWDQSVVRLSHWLDQAPTP